MDRCGSEVDELFMLWDGAEVRWIEVFTGVTGWILEMDKKLRGGILLGFSQNISTSNRLSGICQEHSLYSWTIIELLR